MPRHLSSGPGPDLSLRPTSVHCGIQMKETDAPFLRIKSTPPPTHTHIKTWGNTHNDTRPPLPQIRTGEWLVCRARRTIRGPLPSPAGKLGARTRRALSAVSWSEADQGRPSVPESQPLASAKQPRPLSKAQSAR